MVSLCFLKLIGISEKRKENERKENERKENERKENERKENEFRRKEGGEGTCCSN